jgi:hypothetical protein
MMLLLCEHVAAWGKRWGTHLAHFRYKGSVCIAMVMGAKGVVSRTTPGYDIICVVVVLN